MVPIVTASEGSLMTVTRKPLKAPRTAPPTRQTSRAVSMGMPASHSTPRVALLRARVLATDRSISPVMTTRVMGRAIRAMAAMLRNRKLMLRPVANMSTNIVANNSVTTSAPSTGVSRADNSDPRRPLRDTFFGRRPWSAGAIRASVRSGATGTSSSKLAGGAQGQQAVQADGSEDEGSDHCLVPELVDLPDGQGRGDGGEQDRTECGPVDGPHSPGDGHTTDHGGRDDLQFHTEADGGVDRAVACCEQHPRQAGQSTVDDEGGHDARAHGDAGQSGRLHVGSYGVQLASGTVTRQVETDHDDHECGDRGGQRNTQNADAPQIQEGIGHVVCVDLATVGPPVTETTVGVQGAEGDHQRGDLHGGHQQSSE